MWENRAVAHDVRKASRWVGPTVLVSALAVAASPAGAQRPAAPRPLENVKVLTGWTGDEVRAEMRRINDALGVKCDHCHVQGNFPSDEKRAKHTARRMLQLTMTLNKESFGDHAPKEGDSKLGRVTCYTCHQGALTPKLSPESGARR